MESVGGEAAVLDCFGNMGSRDDIAFRQIGDAARHAQARGAQARADSPRRLAACCNRLRPAVSGWQCVSTPGAVEAGVGIALALLLASPGAVDPLPHRRRAFAAGRAGQRFAGQRRDLDDQVDAVEQGAGQFSTVTGDLLGRTLAAGVAVVAAGARGFNRRHQLETGRKFGLAGGAGDVDAPGFERLAQGFQDFTVEFDNFVEKTARRGGPG